jgi:hypothetical protein
MMNGNPVLTSSFHRPKPRRWIAAAGVAAVTSSLLVAALASVPSAAYAAEASVGLGTARTYSVLGGQAVTNTGPSTLGGDLGVSPGTAITGFPPGKVGGVRHADDDQAAQAQSDLVIGYNDAARRARTASVAGDLVGRTLTSGVYKSTGPLALSGSLTLNGQGNPNAVFIFQVASTLITASASKVKLTNGAQACHVFWQVGSSATVGTASSFKGTIMALTSISVTTGAVVEGRALARNGQVSLDNNTFTAPGCDTTPTTSPTTAPSTPPTTGGTGPGGGGSGSARASGPTSSASGSPALPVTGVSPMSGELLGLSVLSLVLGGVLLAVGRTPALRRRRHRSFLAAVRQ